MERASPPYKSAGIDPRRGTQRAWEEEKWEAAPHCTRNSKSIVINTVYADEPGGPTSPDPSEQNERAAPGAYCVRRPPSRWGKKTIGARPPRRSSPLRRPGRRPATPPPATRRASRTLTNQFGRPDLQMIAESGWTGGGSMDAGAGGSSGGNLYDRPP